MKACAVISLKGGTGKTLVTVNVAYKLKGKVGLIDADLDSPNLAELLGIGEDIESTGEIIKPIEKNGMKVFSMSPVSQLRHISKTGSEYAQILDDVINSSSWGALDYMLVDCPAGSSDVFRTVVGLLADYMVGVIIVSQPMNIEDIHRAVSLCNYFQLPILGLIENMSGYECPHCKKQSTPFGSRRVDWVADKYNLPVLGYIPLSERIQEVVEKRNAILPSQYLPPIDNAVKKIESSEVEREKVGLWKRLVSVGKKLEFKVAEGLIKIFAKFISTANEQVDIGKLQGKYGMHKGRVIEVLFTSPRTDKVVFHEYLRVKDGKLKIVENPKKVVGGVVMDVSTFAKAILKKINPLDSWLSGDIQTFGRTSTPATLFMVKLIDTIELGEIKGLAKKVLNLLAENNIKKRGGI